MGTQNDHTALVTSMIVTNWNTQNKRFNDMLANLSDEQLAAETAPGRNTGHYLLGHLLAVSDALFVFLVFGPRMYPHLDNIFLKNPDKSGLDKTPIAELKAALIAVNAELDKHIAAMQPEEWFTRHSAVSAEDFAKEPHRNKLNLLLNRTTHMGYHMGQMAYLAAVKTV